MATLQELWLVRHGESVGNIAATAAEMADDEVIALDTRDADVPLSAIGTQQARALAGSGDVLAGAITGFAARGMRPERAAVWGAWSHARAGDRLAERMGLGFLARELARELPSAVREVGESRG